MTEKQKAYKRRSQIVEEAKKFANNDITCNDKVDRMYIGSIFVCGAEWADANPPSSAVNPPSTDANPPTPFRQITNTMADTYERKNTAYGNSFGRSVSKYGLVAALTRISDKFNRLENLIINPNTDPNDERLSDTLLDLACYAVMTLIEVQNKENNN